MDVFRSPEIEVRQRKHNNKLRFLSQLIKLCTCSWAINFLLFFSPFLQTIEVTWESYFFCLLSFQLNGATYKSETKFSGGGVGRNIAEGLHKLNGAVSLISAFGRDQNGEFLRKILPLDATAGSKLSDTLPTANCAVILDNQGDCKLCCGDMSIHREITPELVRRR